MSAIRAAAVLSIALVTVSPAASALADYGPSSTASATATNPDALNGTSTLICADSFKPNSTLTFSGPGITAGTTRTSDAGGNTSGTTGSSACVSGTPTSATSASETGTESTYSITGPDHAGTVTRTVMVRRHIQPTLTTTEASNVVTICDSNFRPSTTLTVTKTDGASTTTVATRTAGGTPCFSTGTVSNGADWTFRFTDSDSAYSFITRGVRVQRSGGTYNFTPVAFSTPVFSPSAGGHGANGAPLVLLLGIGMALLTGAVVGLRRWS